MWLLLVIVMLGMIGGILMYNVLVGLRERSDAAWSDIDVQLKRRYDLIPNLVETVKAYAGHERETLESVIGARSRAMDADSPTARARAEGELTGALRHLFAVAEAYPELRASEGFGQLQQTLSELEDHIQNARRYYNAVVRDYNTRTGQVPWNVVARTFGFREKEFFRIGESERAAPAMGFE